MTDTASEMLYPVMPLYLKTIGFSVLLIGVLEGIAEAVAGLSKGYFGKLSDLSGKRVPFVQAGYALSALSKPMMALFIHPLWVFLTRTADRFGKGIRTGARDALLSDEATPATKGKVFGFHRSMDTLGAALGPTLALLYLYFYPEDYKTLFIIALAPGLLAVGFSGFLKEKSQARPRSNRASFFGFLRYWKESSANYRKIGVGLLVFTLFNSSDVFLLLKAREAGLTDFQVVGVYIFYNLIFALAAFPIGIFADKIGMKRMMIIGLLIFTAVYAGMSVATSLYGLMGLFLLYGLYAAATEGVSKAWISSVADKKDTATAIGTMSAFQSICAMLASSLTGFIWYQYGATAAFLMTAGFSLLVAVYFILIRIAPEEAPQK